MIKYQTAIIQVNFTGGIIGMLGSNNGEKLQEAIRAKTLQGWRVVQIMPSDSGNLLMALFRLLLLLCTLFLFTITPGYWVVFELPYNPDEDKSSGQKRCGNCGTANPADSAFCIECGQKVYATT